MKALELRNIRKSRVQRPSFFSHHHLHLLLHYQLSLSLLLLPHPLLLFFRVFLFCSCTTPKAAAAPPKRTKCNRICVEANILELNIWISSTATPLPLSLILEKFLCCCSSSYSSCCCCCCSELMTPGQIFPQEWVKGIRLRGVKWMS